MTTVSERGTSDRDIAVGAGTIGGAWLGIARRILADGRPTRYDDLPILEVAQATLTVEHPDPADPIIARLADPERLEWMHANFTDHRRVDALGGARSYASRLFDYSGEGRDQVQWVIDRLTDDPTSRSATITTFEPLLDTTYIPCVSMLDFWIRDGAVEQVVYAHSIDFGSKGYGNLVELADLQQRVAAGLGIPTGRLVFIIKSAHIYDSELEYMRNVVEQA
jgi:thymidylate synthase